MYKEISQFSGRSKKMVQADTIIKNANIITLDDRNNRSGSIAIKDGKILKIWNEKEPSPDEIENYLEAELIDLRGKTLIPGFIDTHNHLLMYAQNKDRVNCSSPLNKNIGDILENLKAAAKLKNKGEWIVGWGYDDTLLEEKRHPSRQELDLVSPDHPVLIYHTSVHFAVVNSKALALANINDDVLDPNGGHFGRDAAGQLDGVLHEFGAMSLVEAVMPKYSEEDLVSLIEKGADDYLAQGITTSTDAGVGLSFGISEYNAHIKAVAEDRNPLRMRFMILHHLLRQDGPFGGYYLKQLEEEISKKTDGKASLDSAKLFQDGSIQGYTAALRKPYSSRDSYSGDLVHEQTAFNEEIADLHERGFRIAIHGNGDRAIGSNIDALTFALEKLPRDDHRHRIEHVQTATTEDLDRMRDYGIEASFFINHVYYWGERHRSIFLGEERASRMNPLKDAVNRGFQFTLHSDCPVTPISPLFSIWAAVNRLTTSGKVLGEDQKIDVLTALKAMTIYGAYLNFEEDITGTIEVGKRADFAVLDTDPTTCKHIDIKDISVVSTFIGGKKVYEKNLVLTK